MPDSSPPDATHRDASSAGSFDELRAALAQGDVAQTLQRLVARLRSQRKYHELFDALLMQGRFQLGLPIILAGSLEDLPEPARSQVEQVYLEACREVGAALMESGSLREGWMYLRPVGDNALTARALEKIAPEDDNLQDLIEIAVHEGVCVPLGYRLVLERYGTCNAITMFDGVIAGRPRSDQQAAAALLVAHLHRELLANVRADIQKQAGAEPQEQTLAALVADRDWLFGEHNYHVDTTHLASTVRFARVLDDPESLRLAVDLTEYGRKLNRQFQFAGDEPFADTYPSHRLLFRALLGQEADAAIEYFGTRAEQLSAESAGPLPAEVFIALLARAGRYDEALAATVRLLPPSMRTTGFAPNLMELSRRAGKFDRLIQACQARGDLVGFAAGLIEQRKLQDSPRA
jgi:hypothetical protein